METTAQVVLNILCIGWLYVVNISKCTVHTVARCTSSSL